jgi:hypothetical protein
MKKEFIMPVCRISLLFTMLCFSYGCTTWEKKTEPVSLPKQEKLAAVVPKNEVITEKTKVARRPELKSKIKFTYDVLAFRDLKQIDLNHDGTKEILAIYTTKANLGGVGVIKIIDKKTGKIILKQTFNTANIKFRMNKDKPLILVKEKDYLFGWGMNRVYQWDGQAFIYVRKTTSL